MSCGTCLSFLPFYRKHTALPGIYEKLFKQIREGMKKYNFYLLENASHLGTPKQIDTFIRSLLNEFEYLYYTS